MSRSFHGSAAAEIADDQNERSHSMFHINYRVIAGAAIVVAGCLAARLSAQSPATPDLTGTWVFNAELSDRPGQGGQSGRSDGGGGGHRGPGGGGMGRGGGGMGGQGGGYGGHGGGGGGGMPNPEEMERLRATMEAVLHTPARLIIVKGEQGLILTDDEGVSTRLALDGSKETGAINGVPFETTTKWEEGKLRVEKKFRSGPKVIELYSVSSEPRLLTVSLKTEGGRGGGHTIKRVYDEREPGE
jgi:hypothetical protein